MRPAAATSAAAAGDCQTSAASRAAAGVLGVAAGLSLMLPGASVAAEQAVPPPAPQELAVAAAALDESSSPAACFQLAAAPDLVTDADVEAAAASSPSCAGGLETALVSGLEWVVEEAQEVTNFSESNFAAVGAPSSSMWLSNSPWCLMWDAYCNVLTQRPVATKLVTGMVGTFLGDLLAQATQGLVTTTATVRGGRARGGQPAALAAGSGGSGAFALDLSRTARLVGFSALVGTPVAFVWFSLLDQYVCPADPTSPLAVFSKVVLDQVAMAPVMTSVFFAAMAALEGERSRERIASTVRAKLKPTLLANWTVWPLAHVINFALVPPSQRILYINVVNIAWTAFMSHMASSSGEQQEQQQQQLAPPRGRQQQLQQQASR